MIGLVPALLVAAALCVAPAGPGGRVTATTPKAPRDGPERADPERCASDIELFAACVSAGLPAATAAAAVADTHGTRSPWHTVASLTALGFDPQRRQRGHGVPRAACPVGVGDRCRRGGGGQAR